MPVAIWWTDLQLWVNRFTRGSRGLAYWLLTPHKIANLVKSSNFLEFHNLHRKTYADSQVVFSRMSGFPQVWWFQALIFLQIPPIKHHWSCQHSLRKYTSCSSSSSILTLQPVSVSPVTTSMRSIKKQKQKWIEGYCARELVLSSHGATCRRFSPLEWVQNLPTNTTTRFTLWSTGDSRLWRRNGLLSCRIAIYG